MIYGQSGTGKTSILRCGLSNKFKDYDWYPVNIRRKDDINQTLYNEITSRLQSVEQPSEMQFFGLKTSKSATKKALPANVRLVDLLNSLYSATFKPVYLIFDQFEELYILGSLAEQQLFFETVKQILEEAHSCKMVFVMREEYIAHLYKFEKLVPDIFRKRIRIEPMSQTNIEQVIVNTSKAYQIAIEYETKTIDAILRNIAENKNLIQLSYLQQFTNTTCFKHYSPIRKLPNSENN
jgi:hypothetical protein